jgi:hypothetical protein
MIRFNCSALVKNFFCMSLKKSAANPLDNLDWLADQESPDAGLKPAGKAQASRT